MDISRNVIEAAWDNPFLDAVQKIAIAMLIPIAIIIFFEAVVKNMIFYNLMNLTIFVINTADEIYTQTKRLILDCLGA